MKEIRWKKEMRKDEETEEVRRSLIHLTRSNKQKLTETDRNGQKHAETETNEM